MFVFLDTTGSRGSGRGCSRGCRARLRARSARDFTRIKKVPAGFARASRATPAGFAREGVDEVVREVVRASCGLRAGFAREARWLRARRRGRSRARSRARIRGSFRVNVNRPLRFPFSGRAF